MHWEKYPGNPVLSDDFSDGAARSVTSRCYVRYDDGVFCMWYSFAKPDYRILYAESLDGLHWERSTIAPVLDVSPAPCWDDAMVEYPEVQLDDGVYRLWFCGNNYGLVGYAEGIPETGVEVTAVREHTRAGCRLEHLDTHRTGCRLAPGFVQLRAELRSTNPHCSPSLNEITINT